MRYVYIYIYNLSLEDIWEHGNSMEIVVKLLTHLPQCHIYVSVKWVSIGSDNGLSPDWRQDIFWTNAGILLIGPLGTNFSEIWIKIQNFSFMKMHLKMSSGKWRPFCPVGCFLLGHSLPCKKQEWCELSSNWKLKLDPEKLTSLIF